MHRLIKWLVLTVAAVWILVACQSAEPEIVVDVFPTVTSAPVATEPPPPTDEPLPPTEEPETVAVVEETVVEEETAAEEVVEEVVVEEPTEEAVVEEVVVETVEEQPAREAMIINGYTNVIYTQNDADLLGGTGKPQLLNVYAPW